MKPLRYWMALVLVCAILFSALPCYAAQTGDSNYETLFQKAKDTGEDLTRIASELSAAFHADPVGFLKALALEDHAFQDLVCNAVVEVSLNSGDSLALEEQLLNIYASEEWERHEINTVLGMLLSFNPDLSGADDDFLDTLLYALRNSDGIGTEHCGGLLYRLFLQDSEWVLQKIAAVDAEFQELLILQLNYQRSGRSSESQYIETVQSLLENPALSDGQMTIVTALNEKITPTESMDPTETVPNTESTSPIETTPATEATAATEVHITENDTTEPTTIPQTGNQNNSGVLLYLGIGIVVICSIYIAKKYKIIKNNS